MLEKKTWICVTLQTKESKVAEFFIMESPQQQPGPEWLTGCVTDDTLAKCAQVIIECVGELERKKTAYLCDYVWERCL